MDTAAILATLASGSVIGLILGLVGGGGSILAVPLLIYVVGVGSPLEPQCQGCLGESMAE